MTTKNRRARSPLLTLKVSGLEIVNARQGRRRIVATYDARARGQIGDRPKVPVAAPVAVDGVVEMADFKPSDRRCRIHPAAGGAIVCTFAPELADDVYRVLRQPAQLEGTDTTNPHTGKLESIIIDRVSPIDPLAVDAGNFFRGWSLDRLARLQGVERMRDPAVLAGGWPDEDDVDETLADIYAERA